MFSGFISLWATPLLCRYSYRAPANRQQLYDRHDGSHSHTINQQYNIIQIVVFPWKESAVLTTPFSSCRKKWWARPGSIPRSGSAHEPHTYIHIRVNEWSGSTHVHRVNYILQNHYASYYYTASCREEWEFPCKLLHTVFARSPPHPTPTPPHPTPTPCPSTTSTCSEGP